MKRTANAVYGDLKPGDLFMRPGKDFVYEKLSESEVSSRDEHAGHQADLS